MQFWRGRPPTSTRAQREAVYRLADRGTSSRVIAREVYGDVRFRGRVRRLLARRAAMTVSGVNLDMASGGEMAAVLDEILSDLEARSHLSVTSILPIPDGSPDEGIVASASRVND
jgi:hypothetical protein